MMEKRQARTRGFTLIELLVVISIIGVLSSVVLASLTTARYKAHDAKRRSDLISLRTALELYYTNHNAYPSTSGQWYSISPNAGVVTTDWIPGLVADNVISRLPQDPAYPQSSNVGPCVGSPSVYYYHSLNGTGYLVLAHCPVNSSVGSTPASDVLYDPVRPTFAWKVCSGVDCGY